MFTLVLLSACEPTKTGGADTGTVPTVDTVPTPTTTPHTTPTTTTTTTGTPFTVPEGTWSYVPVDGMICGNGTATGIGLNPGADPTKLVVMIEGGGACWDTLSCYVVQSAANVNTGWGAAQLAATSAALDASPLFDRADPTNPWADATFAIVPYCTGDMHTGRTVQHYDPFDYNHVLHHAGDANMEAAVERLQAGVPGAASLWVVGLSAGGYGAQLQGDRFADAWPDADLAILADCAPMVTPYGYQWAAWRAVWDPRLPAGCTTCVTDLTAALEAQRADLGDVRMGLIATRSDTVITLFFTYPLDGLPGAVNTLVDRVYVPDDRSQAFVVDGAEHVLLGDLTRTAASGTTLEDWVTGWRDDDPAWADEY